MDYTVFKVGEQVCSPSADGVIFDIQESGAVLQVRFRKPTAKEKREFKNGKAQFKVVVINGLIFVLSRFGVGNWMDSPFSKYKCMMDVTQYQRPEPGQGIAVHALLIDASTGVLVAQKLIGMDYDSSIKLLDAATYENPHANYDAELAAIYARYSTNDMVRMA